MLTARALCNKSLGPFWRPSVDAELPLDQCASNSAAWSPKSSRQWPPLKQIYGGGPPAISYLMSTSDVRTVRTWTSSCRPTCPASSLGWTRSSRRRSSRCRKPTTTSGSSTTAGSSLEPTPRPACRTRIGRSCSTRCGGRPTRRAGCVMDYRPMWEAATGPTWTWRSSANISPIGVSGCTTTFRTSHGVRGGRPGHPGLRRARLHAP